MTEIASEGVDSRIDLGNIKQGTSELKKRCRLMETLYDAAYKGHLNIFKYLIGNSLVVLDRDELLDLLDAAKSSRLQIILTQLPVVLAYKTLRPITNASIFQNLKWD